MKIIALLLSCALMAYSAIIEEPSSENPYYNNFGSWDTICPKNANCLDGKFNFLCAENSSEISKNCRRFVPVTMSVKSREKMTLVHNGLRNEVAYWQDMAYMNLVYWNIHLQTMAEKYLNLCRPHPDTCLIVGLNGNEVGHNTLFVPRRDAEVLTEWEPRSARRWFLRLGDITPEQLMTGEPTPHMQTLRQVMLPGLEFIGCSAAKMFHGFFIVCYYYPPINKTFKLTKLPRGKTCVCPKKRVMCSLIFTSLCGIDLIGSATIIQVNTFLFYTYPLIIFTLR